MPIFLDYNSGIFGKFVHFSPLKNCTIYTYNNKIRCVDFCTLKFNKITFWNSEYFLLDNQYKNSLIKIGKDKQWTTFRKRSECTSCHQLEHASSKTTLQQNPSVLHWRCQVTQINLHDGSAIKWVCIRLKFLKEPQLKVKCKVISSHKGPRGSTNLHFQTPTMLQDYK